MDVFCIDADFIDSLVFYLPGNHPKMTIASNINGLEIAHVIEPLFFAKKKMHEKFSWFIVQYYIRPVLYNQKIKITTITLITITTTQINGNISGSSSGGS